jgi:hypothetical protein
MTILADWYAAQPCPGCEATTLVLTDDGSGPVRLDCASCGWAETRMCTQMDGDPW